MITVILSPAKPTPTTRSARGSTSTLATSANGKRLDHSDLPILPPLVFERHEAMQSALHVFVQVQRLCCDLSDDGVFNVGVQSDQRNQANDERIERLMLVGDGHAM